MSFAAPIVLIYLLPALFGAGAIWFTMPLMTVIGAAVCIMFQRSRYPKWIEKN